MFWSDNNYYLIIFVLVDNLRMSSVVDMWMVCNRPCDYTWLSRGLVSPTVLFFFGWIGLFDGLVWTMGFSGPCWARALLKWNETFLIPKLRIQILRQLNPGKQSKNPIFGRKFKCSCCCVVSFLFSSLIQTISHLEVFGVWVCEGKMFSS